MFPSIRSANYVLECFTNVSILKFLSDSKATEPDPPQTPLSDDRPFLQIVANLHWLPIVIANRCSNHYCLATKFTHLFSAYSLIH